MPFANVPPSVAETNVVFAGSGSVIVTPLASSLPMFRTVSVYVRLLVGPTGTPASTFESDERRIDGRLDALERAAAVRAGGEHALVWVGRGRAARRHVRERRAELVQLAPPL